jgi:hypothetical protein
LAFIEIPQPMLETFDATETCDEFPTPHASPPRVREAAS